MTIRTIVGLAFTALALVSCGGGQPLKPVGGQELPAVPVGAATSPTAAQLMTPSTQARPQRNVELLTQSQKRQADEFDLPPEKQPQ